MELVNYTAKQLDLINRTVAKDCTPAEFDTFIEICRANNLNPLNREAYALVFSKDDPSKRQITPIVSIDGLRKIGERTGNYRPDENPPRIEYDADLKNPDVNPAGIISCTVTVYKYAHGDWFPCPSTVYWDEFVPLYNGKIPWSKALWREKPRIMIAKVAETQALRKAFPDNFGNLYASEEMDKSIIDITPSEAAEQGAIEARQEAIGALGKTVFFEPLAGQTERIEVGKYYDRVMALMLECKDEPATILAWRDKNTVHLQEFWVYDKNAALDLKKSFEGIEKQHQEILAQEPEMELENG